VNLAAQPRRTPAWSRRDPGQYAHQIDGTAFCRLLMVSGIAPLNLWITMTVGLGDWVGVAVDLGVCVRPGVELGMEVFVGTGVIVGSDNPPGAHAPRIREHAWATHANRFISTFHFIIAQIPAIRATQFRKLKTSKVSTTPPVAAGAGTSEVWPATCPAHDAGWQSRGELEGLRFSMEFPLAF
jgi:hypothetical protein